jgi:hypothetical protein
VRPYVCDQVVISCKLLSAIIAHVLFPVGVTRRFFLDRGKHVKDDATIGIVELSPRHFITLAAAAFVTSHVRRVGTFGLSLSLFRSVVKFNVRVQLVRPSEALAALLASVRLFTSVHRKMSLEILHVLELFAAVGAFALVESERRFRP